MKAQYRTAILLSVLLFGIGFLFAGSATAEESTLEEMNGDGTKDEPYVVTDLEELQAMNEDRHSHYVLGNDIDASETKTWHAGAGFDPIGGGDAFTGSLDGNGYTISNLVIDRPTEDNVGLIGYASGSVENVRLEAADVRGQDTVGTLVGKSTAEIRRSSATGDVAGNTRVGGLIGSVDSGSVETSSAEVDVVSGLQGGGLAGYLDGGSIVKSHAHGDIHAEGEAGGIVPRVSDGDPLRLSYATGDITAGTEGGGLVGTNLGLISSSFSIGEVESEYERIGGLVGAHVPKYNDAFVADSYWDSETSGLTVGSYDADVGTGLRTAEMTGAAAETNMKDFDFDAFWTATDEYPILRWQVRNVSVALDDSTVSAGDQTGVTVTVTLENGSTITASRVAEYEGDDYVDVDAGTVETEQQGTAEITATVAGESDTVDLEITEPPNIELEDASLEAPAVVNGTEIEAAATYANDGGPGVHTVELIVDGETVATEWIRLEADDETTVAFEWTPDDDTGTESDIAIDETALGTLSIVDADAVSLESLSAPERIGSGESYEVTAELETDRDEPVRASVTYELGAEHSVTESVVIEPEGSTVDFDHAHNATPGVSLPHTATLENETLEERSEVAEPPTFEITDVDAPDEVPVNEAFQLTVTVENTGELEGTQPVTVEGTDGELATEEVTVGANATETMSVTATESDASNYEYTISGNDDERTVSVTVEADNDESDDADDGSDGVPGYGSIAALVALSVVALLVRR